MEKIEHGTTFQGWKHANSQQKKHPAWSLQNAGDSAPARCWQTAQSGQFYTGSIETHSLLLSVSDSQICGSFTPLQPFEWLDDSISCWEEAHQFAMLRNEWLLAVCPNLKTDISSSLVAFNELRVHPSTEYCQLIVNRLYNSIKS